MHNQGMEFLEIKIPEEIAAKGADFERLIVAWGLSFQRENISIRRIEPEVFIRPKTNEWSPIGGSTIWQEKGSWETTIFDPRTPVVTPAFPLESPEILLRGIPLPKSHTLRSFISAGDIRIVGDCRCCKVREDGAIEWKDLDPGQFSAKLSQQSSRNGNKLWEILLQPEGTKMASPSYKIDFCIPESGAQEEIDRQFVSILAIDNITHKVIESFDAYVQQMDASAHEYGKGLCNYALGVLIKEGKETAFVPKAEYKGKMQAADKVLQYYDRPTAKKVRDAICFIFNGFDVDVSLPHVSHKPFSSSFSSSELGLPLDTVSRHLLAAFTFLNQEVAAPIDDTHLEMLRSFLEGADEYDKMKIHFVLAAGLIRLGLYADSRLHLQTIQHHPAFQKWVRKQLHKVETGANRDE